MLWFNRKKRLEMIQAIRPTSKTALKVQCLWACNGNVDKAKELYDYFAEDMPNLPDTEPIQPTFLDNTKDALNGVMGWIKENQGTLAQGYEFIRGIVQNRTLPPVTTDTPVPLPPINE